MTLTPGDTMTLTPDEHQRLLVAIEQANQDPACVGQTWAAAFSDACRRAGIDENRVSSIELNAIFKEFTTRRQRPTRSSDAAVALAATIAQHLGETEALPRRQIRRTVTHLGPERAQALLVATLTVEARGGVLLPDGSRRRTPGGVFFHLVRQQASPEDFRAIFHPRSGPRGQAQEHTPASEEHPACTISCGSSIPRAWSTTWG